eukprot:gnl/TRDRNA2_/TRDRNA2_160503_c0_seq1.p1 gnl/TRDRNA2_/TRDRNA2_160503_c0~~gnl/TRDRNA2_/TRDRNA2_160503_c0_seq1.p1  ORF type:complete len:471 (+),score=76.91 gnl/TRDRNA2_/TRDRNA2_160503_c0_seq1:91-1503(+)
MPCDEGAKFYGLYSWNCNGDERRCQYCNQWVCAYHAPVNTDGIKGGHGDCCGPQCQIDLVFKNMCVPGPLLRCAGCGELFCAHHAEMVGDGVPSGGHNCPAFEPCDEGKKASASSLCMCNGNMQICEYCGQRVCQHHRFANYEDWVVGGHTDCSGPQMEPVYSGQDGKATQFLESMPVLGYAVGAAHSVSGHEDRATRAVSRCTNTTVSTSLAVGGIAAGIMAAPVAAGGTFVAACGAAGGVLGGAMGAAAGNAAQYQIEEESPVTDESMPGAYEVHKKTEEEWYLDSAVGGVAGALSGALAPAAQGTARGIMNTSTMRQATAGGMGAFLVKRTTESVVAAPEQPDDENSRSVLESSEPTRRECTVIHTDELPWAPPEAFGAEAPSSPTQHFHISGLDSDDDEDRVGTLDDCWKEDDIWKRGVKDKVASSEETSTLRDPNDIPRESSARRSRRCIDGSLDGSAWQTVAAD